MNKNYFLGFRTTSFIIGILKQWAGKVFNSGQGNTLRYVKITSLIMLPALTASVKIYAQTGAIANNTVAASSNCPGTANVLVYSFSLAQTGTNYMLGFSFATVAASTATSADISNFTVWVNTSNSFPSATATQLGSVAYTTAGATLSLPSWNIGDDAYYPMSGSTYYYFITANFTNTATPGHYIAIAAPATSNIIWYDGETAGTNTATAGNNATVASSGCACSQYYSYTGAVQNFVVPTGCTQVVATVAGAQGGGDIAIYYDETAYAPYGQTFGGLGGVTSASVTVTPGQTIYCYVGGEGGPGRETEAAGNSPGGTNSGGGADGGAGSYYEGGGGGAGSDIRTTSGATTAALSSRILTGGGGGGCGYEDETTLPISRGGSGAYSGVTTGSGGGEGTNEAFSGGGWNNTYDGSPGTLIAGGAAATYYGGETAGGFGIGGIGDVDGYGGGGGGGWYGAGGADIDGACGGSSYAQTVGSNTVSGVTYTDGNNIGSGYIIITPVPPTAYAVSGSGSGCSIPGMPVTLSGSQAGVNYQLYNGSTADGSPVTGTGSAMTFTVTVSGTYTVAAYYTGYSGCPTAMTGSAVITINATPVITGGTTSICVSTTTTFTATPAGGTWSSSSGIVTIGATTGIVTAGSTAGTSIITYTGPDGCYAAETESVNNGSTAAISGGAAALCSGTTITLSDATSGGAWTSLNTTVATTTTGTTTATITGVAPGTATIQYSTGCGTPASVVVTVNTTPTPILGTAVACIPGGSSLSDGMSGGTWSSSATSVATISSTGTITGVSGGTSVISYTTGSCSATAIATVSNTPGAITGYSSVATGYTITLNDATTGGTWSSSNTSIATVSASGVVTGVSAGTVVISYTTACGSATIIVDVYAISCTTGLYPDDGCLYGIYVNTVTISGGACSTSLSDAGIGCTSPAYYTDHTSLTPVKMVPGGSYSTHIADGDGAGTYNDDGYVWIDFNDDGIFAPSELVWGEHNLYGAGTTANIVIPALGIDGVSYGTHRMRVRGSNAALAPEAGCTEGTYGTTVDYLVQIVPSTVTLSSNSPICSSATLILTALPSLTTDATYTWSGPGGFSAVTYNSNTTSTTAPATGTYSVNLTVAGITVCTTGTTAVTTLAAPAISGTPNICGTGNTTSLSDATAGGTWSTTGGSGSVTLAGTTGATITVTGVTAGTANITYITAGGCTSSTIVTVYPTPGTITGVMNVCTGVTTSLTDGTGGTWSEANGTGSATVGTTGIVTGGATGTVTISYITGTSCYSTATVTVYGTPSSISGTVNICGAGNTASLSDGITGGTWTSSNTSVATVSLSSNPTTVTGGTTPGTATITYSMGASCYVTTIASVYALPSSILGTANACTGSTTSLTDAVSGGTWTSSNGNATIGTGGGTVNGVDAGTSVISYATSPTCYATTIVTVYTSPALISGGYTVCQGSTTPLGDATAGGIWTSSNTAIAQVGSTGTFVFVTGESGGVVTITYSTGGSCYVTQPMTVTGIPGTITGNPIVCSGYSINLTDNVSGGSWSTSSGAIATIGSTAILSPGSTAEVTSTGPLGTVTITYNTGCPPVATVVLTVTAAPAAITSTTLTVCAGASITLSDSSPSGTWSSSSPGIGSVGSASGIVTGVSGGTTTISYTTICGSITQVVTVNAAAIPGTIEGPPSACTGLTISLSDPTASGGTGVWSSSNPGIGTVGATTGIVYGVSSGTTTITYMVTSTFCGSAYTTTTVTVNTAPLAGTIGNSPGYVCVGATTLLSDATASGGTGTWSSSNIAAGTVGSTTGLVYGVSVGTTTITYTETSAFCGSAYTTAVVTVDVSPVAGAITGPTSVCTGLTIPLSDATASGGSGIWSSSNPGVGTVGATTGVVYGVSAGTTTITLTETSPSCGSVFTTTTVTVNASPVPGSIGSTGYVCVGATTPLSDATASGGTGTWSSSSPGIGSIDPVTGIVTGISVGTTTITYTETSVYCGSAYTTTVISVDVSPSAGTITGPTSVCSGLTISLSDATASGGTGVWSSSTASAGTVGATTGVVYGVSGGTTTITYTEISASCGSVFTTMVVTVNPSPLAGTIGSPGYVCVGSTIPLSDGTASGGTGTWSSSNIAAGTVGSTTGIVYGVSVGTTTIIYTETSVFCGSAATTTVVTVDLSAVAGTITGPTSVCTGLTITLSDATASGGTGVWSSSNPGIGTVGATTGIVYGVSGGTTTITYTEISGSCGSAFTTMIVTVNPSPVAGAIISSPGFVCEGSTIQLSDNTASGGAGTWSSSNIAAGTAGSTTGLVYGVSVGTTTIIYTETSSFCGSATATTVVTVDVSPAAGTITGPTSVCTGLTITLSDPTASGGTGVWSSGNPGVGTVGATTGIVYGVSSGTVVLTYTITSASCGSAFTTTVVTVNPSPVAGAITGIGYVCVGSTTLLSDAAASGGTGTWSSSNPGIGSVGSATGIVSGISVGTTTITITETSTFCGSAYTTTVVTVNVAPVAGTITGPAAVCAGLTIPLTDITSAGGTGAWSSSNTTIGSVGATTGIVTGVNGGVVTITYTEVSVSCGSAYTTATVTVNANPTPIAGSTNVCVGLTTTLNSTPGGGTWTSSHLAVGTIGATTGIVYGTSPGTTTITYTLGTGCLDSTTVTVNANPTMITGTPDVCVGLTTTLNSTPAGGTWLSSNSNASINPATGVVTGFFAGTSTITYELGTGCLDSATVTVNPNATAITGTLDVCVGMSTTLNSTPAGGTWSSTSGIISVGASSGVVTGLSYGTATVTYTLSTGCLMTTVVTVNPLPSAITGPFGVCVGSTITITDAGGGTWSMSNGNAGISSGSVFGLSAGLDTVTYTLPTGCIATAVVTVNPLPAAITGTDSVCSGLTTALSDVTTGGTWSSSATGIGTVGSTTGIVTGGTSGTATITYKVVATGCIAITVITVNPLPGAINGILTVCIGLTTSLSDATASGTWSSSNTAIAIIGTGGVVTGEASGTSIITYALPTGCIETAIVTVNSLPGTILGTLTICSGLTTSLSDVMGGGTWSSSNTSVATVGSTSGIVTGATVTTASTATITYTAGTGCIMTTVVTVNPLPTAILGIDSVCSGLTTPLSDLTGGGIWSSSATGIASVGSASGIVTGGAVSTLSTAIITYSLTATGCIATTVVTVNPLPTAILGIDSVCSGSTTTLSDIAAGGTWSSGATTIAVVGMGSGIVTGETVATSSIATITYTLPTGCITTTIITVNPLPAAITGTLDVCAGLTTTLADASAPGTWSSSVSSVALIGATTGIVTGESAGTTGIIFVLPTGCQTTAIVTVNPLPGAILGISAVCQNATTGLSDGTSSGTWSSSNTSVATVSGGLVTGTATGALALTATITYTLPTGCITTLIITVNPLPAAITGTMDVCSGLTTTLSDATTGGTWLSGSTGIATVGPTTGVVTGGASGTAPITYELVATGCAATTVVTVNPLPAAILGTLNVCAGLTTSLSDVTPSGTWSSSATGIAGVNTTTGIVTGEGVTVTSEAIITYTIPTGCIAIAIVTVNPLPGTIEGIRNVCLGLKTYLSDAATGGTWSSSNITNVTIGSSTGIVTGNSIGTSIITYTLPTGCIMTAVVTVNPLPAAITGTMNVCVSNTTYLSDATGGGTWSSSNTGIGTAGSLSGGVTGVSAGTVTITYTLPTGCISIATVTVNPQPDAIHGRAAVCYESTTSLSDSTTGGGWSSSNNTIASISTTGNVTGAGAGTATISYTLAAGCTAFDIVTVNPLPAVYTVTPTTGSYCEGGTGVAIGLNGSAVGISYLLNYYRASTGFDSSVTGYVAGTGSPLNFGDMTVSGTYTVLATNNITGCTSVMYDSAVITIIATVNPTVSITSLSGDTVCPGTSVTLIPDTLHAGASPTYKWYVNGELVSLGSTYTYIPANGDVISVTMTSDGICVAPPTATGTLKMNVIPDANPQVSIAIYPGDTVCQYAEATFTATPTFGGPSPVFIWYVNGVQSGTGAEFSYYPTTGDIVSCKMASDYQCRLSDTAYSNVAVMTIIPMIVPHVEIEANPGLGIGTGTTDSLWTIVTYAGPYPTYQWEVNGVPVPGATMAYYVSQFNNYDSVTCIVTSSGACDGISSYNWVFITVFPAGVQQYAVGSGDIKLIPNPNNGVFTLKGTLGTVMDEEVTIEITDMIGQVVYSNKVMVTGGNINEQIKLSSTLANGMYLLNLLSGSDNKVFHFVMEQ